MAIPRTRLGWTISASVLAVSVVVAAPPAVAYWRLSAVERQYAALQNAARAVEIYDSTHRLIGIAEASANGAEGHLVLPAKSVPDGFYRVYEALEDKPRINPLRNWFGIDAYSSAIAVGCQIYKETIRPNQKCRGGSTIEQSTARGWNSRFGGMDGRTKSDKLEELKDATSLSVIMSRDPAKGRILAADAISFGTAPGGFEMWGLRNATLTTFGVEPEQASLGQLGIIAAMAKWRIAWSCDPAHQFNADEAAARTHIKNRAIYGIQKAFPAHDPAAQAAIAEVRAMTIPTAPAALDPALTAGLDARSACLAAANPINRVQRLMPGESAALRAELRAVEQRYGKVEAIELTEDLASHSAFQTSVAETLAMMDRDRGSFGERLTGDGLAADTLSLVVNAGGHIERLATTSQRDMLHSEVQTGSTGKLAIALAASRFGIAPDMPLCQMKDQRTHVRDVGGFAGFDRCDLPGASISVSAAFGQSKNLPILDLGRRLPASLLEQAMHDTGFTLDPQTERPFGLVTGLSLNSPARIAATQQAIANGIAGKPAVAFLPTIIARVRVNGKWLVPEPVKIDLTPYFATPQARAFMATAATAALTDPRGTLRGILIEAAEPLETAKSGTVPGPRPLLATRIKWGSGALAGRGSWVSLIAARSSYVGDASFSSIPLSRLTRASALAPRLVRTQPVAAGN